MFPASHAPVENHLNTENTKTIRPNQKFGMDCPAAAFTVPSLSQTLLKQKMPMGIEE
jgi:hypothetical protein